MSKTPPAELKRLLTEVENDLSMLREDPENENRADIAILTKKRAALKRRLARAKS